jgi:hypothetical protein
MTFEGSAMARIGPKSAGFDNPTVFTALDSPDGGLI